MLTMEELEFCEDVKNYSLEHSGKEARLAVACQPHSNSYIFKIELNDYQRVKLIFKKLLGDNYNELLANRDEEYKNCKVIDLLLVGV